MGKNPLKESKIKTFDKKEYFKIVSAIIETILKDYSEFKSLLVKKTGKKVDKATTREFLILLLFCTVDSFQKWEIIEKKQLDLLLTAFYQEIINKKIINPEELYDFELEKRKRWRYFYKFLGEEFTIQAKHSKKFSTLIAKESLYINELLLGVKKSEPSFKPIFLDLGYLYAWVSGLQYQVILSTQYLTRKS